MRAEKSTLCFLLLVESVVGTARKNGKRRIFSVLISTRRRIGEAVSSGFFARDVFCMG